MDLATLLRSVPQFSALAPSDIDAMASAFVIDDFSDGHVFIRQGAHDNEVFVLVEGEVLVTASRAGKTRELSRMRAGDLFGLLALVDDEPRSATCRAAGKCTVGSLAPSAASLLFNQRAPIACAFQQVLATQLARDFRRLDTRLRELLAASPPT